MPHLILGLKASLTALVVFLSSMRQMLGACLKTVHILPCDTALATQFINEETNHQNRHDTDVDNILNAYSKTLIKMFMNGVNKKILSVDIP